MKKSTTFVVAAVLALTALVGGVAAADSNGTPTPDTSMSDLGTMMNNMGDTSMMGTAGASMHADPAHQSHQPLHDQYHGAGSWPSMHAATPGS